MSVKDEIRLTLIKLMDEASVTGKELAESIGVTPQAVSAWKNGRSSVDLERIPKICETLGITIEELFKRSLGAMNVEKEKKPENEQNKIMLMFESLDADDQARVNGYIDSLLESEKYRDDGNKEGC